MLAGIWIDVLHLKAVSVHDNFFELGGHSLLATQVTSRIQKHWQREVPLRLMFEHATIAELAQTIDNSHGETLKGASIVPRRYGVDLGRETFPLSFSQQRLWVLDRLEPNTSVYNIPMTLRL